MEIAAETQKKAGFFAYGWDCLKSSKTKLVQVAKNAQKQGQDDPRKIIHSLKVGLALTLISMFYYFRPLYDSFGVSGMWAVLTVVVVFEFTVGATLSKSLNRGFATMVAGALGVGAQELASLFGEEGEPIVLGILVFLLATASTFSRFFPRIKARYDYGVLIFILTFSLVAVSGYRVNEIIELAHQRLSTILVGGATCIIIAIFVCPVWAGEDLHNMTVRNMEKLANFLEGFGGEYFKEPFDGESVVESKDDKSFLQGYKSALNSKSSEESLANFASWEPCHGRFRFRHPWKQYLMIGALTRQCAYHIEAISSYINSEIQVSAEFRMKIQEPCTKISSESGEALKALASAIKTMTDPSSADPHVANAKAAVKDLEIALNAASLDETDLLEIIPDATVASILIEIVKCMEKVSESVHELSGLAHFKVVEPNVTPEKPQLLHRGTIQPIPDGDATDVIITIDEASSVSPENDKGPSKGKQDESHVNMC